MVEDPVKVAHGGLGETVVRRESAAPMTEPASWTGRGLLEGKGRDLRKIVETTKAPVAFAQTDSLEQLNYGNF